MSVVCMLRATFAINPAGITVRVVFLFPDRQAVLEFVDDVAASAESLVAMLRRNAYPDRTLADLENADAMHETRLQ